MCASLGVILGLVHLDDARLSILIIQICVLLLVNSPVYIFLVNSVGLILLKFHKLLPLLLM